MPQTPPRRVFYDAEFLDDGDRVHLISIGMVDDRGHVLSLVNAEMPWRRVKRHPWLAENAVPHLPTRPDWRGRRDGRLNHASQFVTTKARIAEQVAQFLHPGACEAGHEPIDWFYTPETEHNIPRPELWAWYGAYDHVALAQLFGPMAELPPWIPMYTRDLQQEADRLGVDLEQEVPRRHDPHEALSDAFWNRDAWRYLNRYTDDRPENPS
jgi:hypothetical protein